MTTKATNPHGSDSPRPLAVRTDSGRDRPAVLVVGVDGSDTSWNAFSWASGEARRLQGRLIAVFVTPEVPAVAAATAVPGVPGCDYRVIQNAAAEQATRLRAEAHRSTGRDLDLTFIHARGDTATELLQIAQAAHADQIIVGRSTKLRHRLTGALGRRLIAKPAAPVIVIVP
jgi:nucleotide-binding universal stress UspA family protein